LDYFHSRKAISPDDPSTFYRLITNSCGITIAKESEYVEEEKLEGEEIDSAFLFDEILTHINNALIV